MSSDYRIESNGTAYTVTDPLGERVGVYDTEDAAQSAVDRNKAEDETWETAKLLFDLAVKTLMQMQGVERDTARRLMRDAAEVVD